MPPIVFTHSASSHYDDQPELRYHFPRTYLNQVKDGVGEFALYYEPRRTMGPESSTGRQAYFAVARVREVTPDPGREDHFYAWMSDYLEFDTPVPFRRGATTYESGLSKRDGTTNKGAFGRAVRLLDRSEFETIVRAGFTTELMPWERDSVSLGEGAVEYPARPVHTQLVSRPFRDVAFRRHVRAAYGNTCAVSGLRLINGGGRPEVQAAHIRPVAAEGPDTVRNGLALTGTLHWLFDRGLLAVADDYRLLTASSGVPADVHRLLRPDRRVVVPESADLRPHPAYLRWHRENVFKG